MNKDATAQAAPTDRRITIDPITRLEGHGRIEIFLDKEGDVENADVLMSRGPASESPGAPSVFVQQEESSGLKLLYIGFPLYLLPKEAKTRLVLNAVTWMLGP